MYWHNCPNCGRYIAPIVEIFEAIKKHRLEEFIKNSPVLKDADYSKIAIVPEDIPEFEDIFTGLGIPKKNYCCRIKIFTLERIDKRYSTKQYLIE